MIEDEIADTLVKEIQKEIDEGIMLSLLVEEGWTKVSFRDYNTQKVIDMDKYCKQNFKKNQWLILNGHFVFRKKQDAEWFILRWT